MLYSKKNKKIGQKNNKKDNWMLRRKLVFKEFLYPKKKKDCFFNRGLFEDQEMLTQFIRFFF